MSVAVESEVLQLCSLHLMCSNLLSQYHITAKADIEGSYDVVKGITCSKFEVIHLSRGITYIKVAWSIVSLEESTQLICRHSAS